MKYLWRRLMPFATDATGLTSLFADADALIIGHDPRATVGRNYRMVEPRTDTTSENVGLWSSELAYTLGDPSYFVNQYMEQIDRFPGRLIVLVHSPVSSLVSIDLTMLASEIRRSLPEAEIFSVPVSGNAFYDRGLSDAFVKIARQAVKQAQGAAKEAGTVNILGLNALDFPSTQQRNDIKKLVGSSEIISIYGTETNLFDMYCAGLAERNIVVSVSGLEAARILRDELGTPFSTLEEHATFNASVPNVGSASNVLIIGEQFTSNALRGKLLARGAENVTVAGFFTMDAEYMREGDVRLSGESDLSELIAESNFDAVIGDSAFRQFAEGGAFYEVHHPSVSGGGSEFGRGGNPWRGR